MPAYLMGRARAPARLVLTALTITLLGACASAYNSGVQPRGADSYYLAVRTPSSKGGGNESQRQARAEANEYCAKSGKVAKIYNEEVGPVQADIYFSCVAQ